jgi:hypothetical protein
MASPDADEAAMHNTTISTLVNAVVANDIGMKGRTAANAVNTSRPPSYRSRTATDDTNAVPLNTITPQVTVRELTINELLREEAQQRQCPRCAQRAGSASSPRKLYLLWFLLGCLEFGAFMFGLFAVHEDAKDGGMEWAKNPNFIPILIFLLSLGTYGMGWTISGFFYFCIFTDRRIRTGQRACGLSKKQWGMLREMAMPILTACSAAFLLPMIVPSLKIPILEAKGK